MLTDILLYVSAERVLPFARVVVGTVMIYYGWPKIKDVKSNADDFVGMGFKPGWLWGTIVAFLEFFGGIFIVAGFFEAVVAALYVIQMLMGAIWKITRAKKPFTDWSYDLLVLTLCLVIVAFSPALI